MILKRRHRTYKKFRRSTKSPRRPPLLVIPHYEGPTLKSVVPSTYSPLNPVSPEVPRGRSRGSRPITRRTMEG